MLRLSELALPGRGAWPRSFGVLRGPVMRQDDWSDLGRPTPEAIVFALEEGRIEWGGHPLWVTEYDDDAGKPCPWHKRAELIPQEAYERVSREKPEDGAARY